MIGYCFQFLISASCSLPITGGGVPAAEPIPKEVGTFLEEYCVRCHNSREAKGELNFEAIADGGKVRLGDFKHWQAAASRVAWGQMPPGRANQPTDAERAEFARWYRATFVRGAARLVPYRVRRLSTPEYTRTIDTLIGAAVTAPGEAGSLVLQLMPADPRGASGFTNDTSGSAITLALWEKYDAVADAAVARLFSPDSAKLLKNYSGAAGQGNLTPAGAAEFLDAFRSRALRRPIGKTDQLRHAEMVRDSKAENLPLVLKREAKSILMSPEFLYRGLLAPVGPGGRGDSYELAERMSYFLWADMPDAELLAAAGTGKLSDEATLKTQLRRMWASPKARSLADVFGVEWLQLNEIDSLPVESAHAAALKGQATELLSYLISSDRPIRELFDTRTEFVNPYVANYYRPDLPQLPPGARRPRGTVPLEALELRNTSGRGGLLTLPGVLTMNKGPIQRGAWVLERILGEHLGEPPPDVPPIKPAKPGVKSSFRERFAEHRARPACASCHDRIDPLGFAFELYNDVGGFRPAADAGSQKPGLPTVAALSNGRLEVTDAAGQLPSGEKFKDCGELRHLLTTKLWPRVVDNLVRQVLAYALARELQAGDELVIEELVARLSKPGATWGDLITGVVLSPPFRLAKYASAP